MSDEKTICEVCKKEVDCVMTISVSGGNPTPPICNKCFKEGTDRKLQQLREGQEMPKLTAVKDVEKATAPPELDESDFWFSDQIEVIAGKLIDENETQFGHLKNFRVAYLFKKEMTGDAKGKATVLSGINRLLSGFDAHIVICYETWKQMTDNQRNAIVAHEMTHIDISENGDKLKIREHDLEEFSTIAAKFGKWNSAIAKFSEQLDLFEGKGK